MHFLGNKKIIKKLIRGIHSKHHDTKYLRIHFQVSKWPSGANSLSHPHFPADIKLTDRSLFFTPIICS